ncbi:uncharacterized protein LOC119767000 [Culex quinquefasciatus]|uniref:uncharacterized protein LOC119767000 n=1 Tax=Culex quinquefasciatus TaxID=7176 RepID=UPI0018E38916|nr:uncharacterized protein LOC119767000 [Culex quinquefasciatus]
MLIKANIWVYVFQLVVMKVTYAVYGLDSVHIRVPQAVALGSSAVLICECDLPDEDLYSVKWYKGKHEFFRYTSKEIPSIKIFPKAGINVNVDHSNASHVILGNVEPHTSGKYSCEVTEAAPSFHTKIVTRDLNVVDLPKSDPVIVDMKPYYGADEFLEVECISNESLPAARLEWLINDQPLGVIQPPSRLEFLTLPAAAIATSGSGSSSNSSSGTDGSTSTVTATSSKKSTKSSLRHKSDEESSDLTNSLEGGGGELAVPLAMIASAAAALSLTTSSTSTGSVLPSPAAIHAGSSSGKSGGGKKALVNSRYERSVARLKLLLGHEHFEEGKIKVKCIARIFDVYERTALQVADENYPQVRVLSKSDNGVHYSFMSDKDEASSKASSSSSSQLFRPHHWWSSMVLRPVLSWLAGNTATTKITGQSQLQDTGQSWTSQLLGGTTLAAFLLSWNTGASELLIALPMATMLLLF